MRFALLGEALQFVVFLITNQVVNVFDVLLHVSGHAGAAILPVLYGAGLHAFELRQVFAGQAASFAQGLQLCAGHLVGGHAKKISSIRVV